MIFSSINSISTAMKIITINFRFWRCEHMVISSFCRYLVTQDTPVHVRLCVCWCTFACCTLQLEASCEATGGSSLRDTCLIHLQPLFSLCTMICPLPAHPPPPPHTALAPSKPSYSFIPMRRCVKVDVMFSTAVWR